MLSLNLVELIQSFTGAYLPHKGRDLAPVSVGKVVIDVSSTAKGLLQQNLLRFVRIYSNFRRLFHVKSLLFCPCIYIFSYDYSKAVNVISIRDFHGFGNNICKNHRILF